MIKTLVVDDDPHIRRLLARLLTPHRHHCSFADGVEGAGRLLSEQAFDLALVDVRMAGETDGLELLREIGRRHNETATVMLTAVEDPQMAATAYQLGADGYLLKPFRPGQLLITVTNAMDRRQVEADNARHRHELTRVLAAEQQARERAVRAVQRARALARISDGLVATRDLPRLHDEVAQALTTALADGCAVVVEAAQAADHAAGQAAGQAADRAGGRYALGSVRHRDPPVGRAFADAAAHADLDALVRRAVQGLHPGHPCIVNDLSPADVDAAGLPHPLAELVRRRPVRSLACQPVRLDEELVGMVVAWRHDPADPFEDEEATFLAEVAERLSLAADNARLHALSQDSVAKLQHHALHDPLTDLPNRVLFVDLLRQAISNLERGGGVLAVLFLDLDRFEIANDSLGHAVGDQLLVATARRLTRLVRVSDVVARFGGDEFAMAMPVADAAEAAHVAQRVLDALAEPLTLENQEMVISASIGITVTSDPRARPDDLLREADTAMYRAKEGGRARLEVFGEAMREEVTQRLHDEAALRRALDGDQMRVYYQPVLDLTTEAVVGAEALVRWQHPERGLLSAGAFIGLAEETRLVVSLGNWVLGEACRQFRRWRDLPPAADLSLHVNVSPLQFTQPDFVGIVGDTLARTGMPPRALCLEITETTIMDDVQAALPILQGLRDLGVRLCIDDFGTGYSSLNYLRQLPIDGLKIDKSFVDVLGIEPDARGIVLTVIELAQRLRLTAIAEGVETERQHTMLVGLGCRFAHGFRFAHPLPGESLPEAVRSPAARR